MKVSPSRTRPGPDAGPSRPAPGDHILIIVQNLPVPLDRRVWLECQALRARGYEVSVICPMGPGDPSRQTIDGIEIYKYPPPREAHGLVGFCKEFAYCWLHTARLSWAVWHDRPFTVMQACNPPDTFWALARIWRSRGVRFVFDQHDLNPELFLSRFGPPATVPQRVELAGLRWLEAMTYRTADKVISTNESYKAIAVGRGGRQPSDVTVVRSGPDTRRMRPVYPEPSWEKPRKFSVVYLGIMGPQDGVDLVLDVMHDLVHLRGRDDVQATLLGFGDCLDSLRCRTTDLGLNDHVVFTGRADRHMIADHLSVADVGLCPDLKTPLNDVSTMNKTMEYMAYALPSVAFDLVETRVSGGDSVLYVPSGDAGAFADAVERLLDNPELRIEMARQARRRVVAELDWRPQARAYVSVYDALFGAAGPAEATTPGDAWPPVDERGRRYVDLDDVNEFERFIRERSAP